MTQGNLPPKEESSSESDWFHSIVQQMQRNIRGALKEVENVEMDDVVFNEKMANIEKMQNILSYLQQRRYAYLMQSRAKELNKFL